MSPEPKPVTGNEVLSPTEPGGALAEFYRAFNNRDLTLMERNWEQSGDSVMDNPIGGITRGWPEIRRVYERIFGGKARVNVEFYDYTIVSGADMFVAIGRERGSLIAGGETLAVAFRTSRIFRKSAGRWHQVHHHGSSEDAAMLAEYKRRL